jgi:serine protease Do
MQIDHDKKIMALFLSISIFFWGFGGGYLLNANVAEYQQGADLSDFETNVQSELTGALKNVASSSTALSIPEIVTKVAGSVVEITTEMVTGGNRIQQYIAEGAGSGVILTSDGYIATNNHVVEGANKITVTLHNGTQYTGQLIGRDVANDLAVIKIDADKLIPVKFGDASKLVVGELAVAIGNPLGELGGTVTDGIISALNRVINVDGVDMTLLQTSAAISPGNSGGGLFNSRAELIGIVNAKSSGSDVEGLGFAIPINTALEIIDPLMTYGYIPGKVDPGFTVIHIQDAWTARMYRLNETGFYVATVSSDNGLNVGDRIVSIDGVAIIDSVQIDDRLAGHSVGDILTFEVVRAGNLIKIDYKLAQAKF